MSSQEDFKKAAERALTHAIAWREDGPKLPSVPCATAAELKQLFDIGLPEAGRDGVDIIDQLVKAASAGLVTNTHPNFYSWVQGSSHPIGVAADLLTSAWGQNASIYQTSPAAAMAEDAVARWLLELLHLPLQSSIGFATGATMASFICLSAARSDVLNQQGYDLEQEGLIGAPNVQVFLGEEAHATIYSDLRYLGFGLRNITKVAADGQGRMLSADLEAKLALCDSAKIVICQAGHINSGAFDPFAEIIPIAHTHNAWVHVDGAFGLWANAVPSLSHHCEAIEQADSWTVDGHKWLQVPYDSGFAIVKNEQAHQRAMDINASYLVNNPDDGRNPSRYGPELSRRARGFAVWATLQALGRQGVIEMVSRHCACAKLLQQRLDGVAGIRVLNDVVLNQVAIAFGEESESLLRRDQMTAAVVEAIRQEDKNFVLGASWKGQAILRISVISLLTNEADIETLADSILRAWQSVR